MSTDWDSYQTFLDLLRDGSFAATARRTGLTAPTLRQRIGDLEHRLGVILFARTPDGVVPTAAGRKLRPQVESMDAAARSFLQLAADEARQATGMVTIACGELTALALLPQVIASLGVTHPGLCLRLVMETSSAGLIHGRFDIAVLLSRPTHKALHARRVGAVRIGLYAHQSYLAVAGSPASAADLSSFSLIGAVSDPFWMSALRTKGVELEFDALSFRSDHAVAQLAAIRAGLGIGAVETRMAAEDQTLVRVLADEIDHAAEPWVITHEDLRHDRRIRVVYDAIVEHLSAYETGRTAD